MEICLALMCAYTSGTVLSGLSLEHDSVEMEGPSVQGADSKIKALENSLRALVSASTLPQARGLIERTLQSLSKAENEGQALLYVEVGC